MNVAAIVVNYGTADLAIAAVESLLAQVAPSLGLEVHLVDNASPGDEAARLQEVAAAQGWGARVVLWPEPHNHGFGQGNNVVLRALADRPADDRPDFVFLLNPDAALVNDAVSALAEALTEAPEAAAAGASIRNSTGDPATCAFRFPTLVSEITRLVDFGPLTRLAHRFRVSLPPSLPRREVDWVSGAAVMFRFEALMQAEFFDPAFFLYYEEVDLMRRLKEMGWQVLHVPEAIVLHHAGAATGHTRDDGQRRRSPPYVYHSWQHYYSKVFGRWRTLGLGILLVPAAALNVAHHAIRGQAPSLPKSFFRDHWRYAIRPLAGLGEGR